MMGAAAMSNPVSELERCRSASDSNSHAAMISKKAKTNNGLQCFSTGAHAVRDSASGASTASADGRAREHPSTGGETPLTATFIKRYGIPQMTLIAAKSSQPRGLTRG